jgi:hypothetical protein
MALQVPARLITRVREKCVNTGDLLGAGVIELLLPAFEWNHLVVIDRQTAKNQLMVSQLVAQHEIVSAVQGRQDCDNPDDYLSRYQLDVL